MGLTTYRNKRSATKTPEPFGGRPGTNGQLHFVVQKHDASHLHYDFRLEMKGVLKSWAVPKGPSTDPTVKRLAMMVEDHPYDYKNFEGVIPKGQYGGGTVIVWDEGTYEPAEGDAKDRKTQEKQLLHQLHKGKIVFNLNGQKLKGQYALVKSTYQGENSWLLTKVKDRYAKATDILKKDKSVLSGKTITQMARDPERIYGKTKKPSTPSKKKPAAAKKSAPKRGKKAAMPTKLRPMLATLVDNPVEGDDWAYEIKWDGYRALAYVNKSKVAIRSRNDLSFDEKFYPIRDALKKLDMKAVLDGEIVVTNKEGVSNFGSLQNWRSEADGELLFYVFDVLWLDGYSLTHLTYMERRERLEAILPEHPQIRLSNIFETSAGEFLEAAKEIGLEGIMAKKKDSLYYPGQRSKEWLKIKTSRRHEVVIGGFTNNEGSDKTFSALLVGVYEKGKLIYTGKVGTGFSDKQQREMMKQFKPLITTKIPFDDEPDVNKPSRFRPNPPHAKATWLKPKLVCEVNYTEMTSDGVMRHPAFVGMRDDKKASDVKPEKAAKMVESKATAVVRKKHLAPSKDGARKTLVNPSEKQQVRKVGSRELTFTNLQKIFWPKEKISKGDVINYYYQVAPYIMPYMKDRPQSLNRHPNGINGQSFYQKNIAGKFPDWLKTHNYKNTTKEGTKKFMVCSDEATLLYMANLGCIEMNPWHSRVESPDNPDWCVVDLDPDNNSFEQVIEVAQHIHEIAKLAGFPCYPKTSGSTGMHIYIPLGAKYSYDQSKVLAELIVSIVHRELPSFTSLERSPSKRKGKIYLDFLQNRSIQTIAAPYSIRPKPGATVSMPLDWSEVKKGLKVSDFHIHNAVDRLKETGDLFKPVLGRGISIEKVLKKLEGLVE